MQLGAVISHETVKTYVSRILTKLDLRDRVAGRRLRLPARPGDLSSDRAVSAR
jgi:hypothetical protein